MKKIFNSDNLSTVFANYHLFSAFSGGVFGFLLFFLIIVIVKTISFWLGTLSQIKIEPEDIMLSLIGLVLMALIKILEELRLKEPLS
ncbi:MAG: hypothetical protein GXO85_05160 [Chlorobi bacterium]|nr:hypothetical protein [Chlorobiota bacterium]